MILIYLLLLFTVLPLVEFSLLWSIAGQLGLVPTVLLVLVTGFIGAGLARQQGVSTLIRIRGQLASNQMPTDALLDAALILVAGAVLITPGVLTDLAGFGLLSPPVRAVVKRGLTRWAAARVRVAAFGPTGPMPNQTGQAATSRPAAGDSVIDVEAVHTRVEDV
ncbi:MAG: FxsA family protein [Planctomycetota bacterium]